IWVDPRCRSIPFRRLARRAAVISRFLQRTKDGARSLLPFEWEAVVVCCLHATSAAHAIKAQAGCRAASASVPRRLCEWAHVHAEERGGPALHRKHIDKICHFVNTVSDHDNKNDCARGREAG